MNGEWVILIWVLISVIFLMGNPAVREFFAKVRKMSAIGIICMVLSLGFLADVSYTKDGATTNQTSQTSVPSPENSSLIVQTSALPSFWKDDPTDTDGDGIPDLWEKWTHGKKLVADSDLDRDGDGLSDLEEFWNQTDPRTADTDGDGFSDSFEIANGMNPISAEDFIPAEPDTNGNGVPDIWEQIGYSGSFQDANGNGFDDTYESYNFPAASDGNFDVLVDVYTTRSAALNWTSGENMMSMLMLPTTGTSVKIRLPFGEDIELDLQSSPSGTDLPSGELWKARMGLSFVPRSGQNTAGTCIMASTGDISQKVVGQASVITRFSDAPTSRQTLSQDGGDSNCPRIDILRRRYFLIPDADVYHASGDVVGPFDIVNTVNIDEDSVHWSVDYGTMDSAIGFSSSLTVTSIPPNDEPIIVTATVQLDESFSIIRTATVNRCPRNGFSLDSYTVNFSPHLGETHVTSMTLPGCFHQNDLGWLEIEIMRETTEGWQHVAWIDMDPSTSGVDRYGDTVLLPGHPTFIWDGVATEGAAAAESPDEFTAGTTSFHRALPQVVAGEPVPPPYYTTFVRLWNDGKNKILEEESRTFYVPQVVKIEMTDEAYNEFKKEILYPETFYPKHLGNPLIIGCESNVVLYAGCTDRTKAELLAQIAAVSQNLYPEDANIRFATSNVEGRTKIVQIMCDYSTNAPLGKIMTDQVVFPNAIPSGVTSVNMNIIRWDSSDEKLKYENGSMTPAYIARCEIPTLFPFSANNLAHAVASSTVHETGHLIGLVSIGYLGGKGWHNNNNIINGWIMNDGAYTLCVYHLGSHSNRARSWNTLNASYLQFILPTGGQ